MTVWEGVGIRLVHAMAVIGGLSYLAAGLVTLSDIVLRQFGSSWPGVVDWVQLFVVAGTFASMPYAFLASAHVRVEILLDTLSPSVRNILLRLMAFVMLVLVSGLAYYIVQGLIRIADRGSLSQNLGWPMTVYWTPMAFGLVLSVPVLIYQLRSGVYKDVEGDDV